MQCSFEDCCDGSDEWDSAVECPNICEEMGSKCREEIQRRAAVAQKVLLYIQKTFELF